MTKYINIDHSYDTATLTDWYINSVTDEPPVWTEEHLEELLNDFYVIPKDTPAADVVEVKHGYWEKSTDNGTEMHQCSVCGARVVKGVYEYENPNKYCYHCGAKMEQILRIVDDGVKDVTTPELIKRYNHYFGNGYIDDDTEE